MANTRLPTPTTQGDYRADVTRDTFDPLNAFRRVIAQQGRPVLDADLNEQTSILLYYLECLAQDLGGPHFGNGFQIEPVVDPNGTFSDLKIGAGRYYAQGLLCENTDDALLYKRQPYACNPLDLALKQGTQYLVYLDAWEEHVTALQQPHMREVALGGADTSSRGRVVWQIKYLELPKPVDGAAPDMKNYDQFMTVLRNAGLLKPGTALLRARTDPSGTTQDSPCVTAPAARYRGPENQLYRVEVHDLVDDQPRFKCSRENSSVLFAVADAQPTGNKLTLLQWARDDRFGLSPLDWVELVDDGEDSRTRAPRALLRVLSVDRDNLEVTLDGGFDISSKRLTGGHIYLRRWEQRGTDPANPVTFAQTADDDWVDLEQGIQVQFSLGAGAIADKATCQIGDYWLIPARVATGDVEWPAEDGTPLAQPAHGILHRYAPLAVLQQGGEQNLFDVRNLKP